MNHDRLRYTAAWATRPKPVHFISSTSEPISFCPCLTLPGAEAHRARRRRIFRHGKASQTSVLPVWIVFASTKVSGTALEGTLSTLIPSTCVCAPSLQPPPWQALCLAALVVASATAFVHGSSMPRRFMQAILFLHTLHICTCKIVYNDAR